MLFVKWSFYAFIVSLVCIVIHTPLSHSGLITFILAAEISLSFLLFRTLAIMKVRFAESDGIVYRVIMTISCVLWKSSCPLYPSRRYKRGLNSFRINSPSRIQWKSRQYHAERTIHIEFKADFTESQRIIRLRDRDAAPCSRVRTGKMNIPC